jgi:hypothetical protein
LILSLAGQQASALVRVRQLQIGVIDNPIGGPDFDILRASGIGEEELHFEEQIAVALLWP